MDLHVFLTDNKFCNERRCLETVVHQNFHGFIVDGVSPSILSPNLDCYKELLSAQDSGDILQQFLSESALSACDHQ